LDFNGETQTGEMIVSAGVAADVIDIFEMLYLNRYPIEKIRLIDHYEADDGLSMADNNTSAFNFRFMTNSTKISKHGYGLAIDINPVQNPYISGNAVLPPSGAEYADRTDVRPGMIVKGDECYSIFISRGWEWGGDWNNPKDYQHFEK
jgi:hypothetical protein